LHWFQAHRINEFENEGTPLDAEIENKEQVANKDFT
jgi:hypothetical protein